jgi:MFS family permease
MGSAYVGDIVEPDERGLAFGLYTTSMGLGFTVGPLFGAAVETRFGIRVSYFFAAGLTFLGAMLADRGLRAIVVSDVETAATRLRAPWSGISHMFRNRGVLAGSLGNLLMSVSFGGAVANFFPVLLAGYQVSQAAISSMFSARAFASTLSRLPTGAVTSRVPSRIVMSTALVLAMGVQFLMAQTSQTGVLAGLLLLEGVAFGTFLTSGQVFVAENSTADTRGAAVGAYSTAGSLGSTFSSIVLGLVADRWGVPMVFRLTGATILLGLLLIGYLSSQKKAPRLGAAPAVAEEA